MQDFSVLARTAASQHGLLTTQQLSAGGFGRRAVDRMVASGRLDRRERGVVAIAGSSASWEQNVASTLLSIGGLVVASHRSALRLWGLRSTDDDVDIAMPDNRVIRRRGVVVHRSVDLQAEDRTILNGIPTTTAARTLVDAGLIFPETEVRRLVSRALVVKIVGRGELWNIRKRVGERGRNGAGVIERALELLAPEEGADSAPELEMRSLLIQAGVESPVAQFPVFVGGKRRFIDMAYPVQRLALEYDGFDVHTRLETFEEDRRRQNELQLERWRILRYTWDDLRRRPESLIGQVRRALRQDF